MLLTSSCTFIHMPKTGGTFVTSAMERLHGPRTRLGKLLRPLQKRFRLSPWPQSHRYGPLLNLEPKHATCHEVPASQQGKPILSCVRRPHDWYVSQYEFGWWKRTLKYDPGGPSTPAGWAIEQVLPRFAARHPHFPDIDFSEFMELCSRAADLYNQQLGTDFGLFTHGFVRYFYRDPPAVLAKLDESYITSGEHRKDRFDVTFLRTERLNSDLQSALATLGYDEEDLAFISGMGKALPMGIGRRDDQQWEDYYTPPLAARVRQLDWPLFNMFPFYG